MRVTIEMSLKKRIVVAAIAVAIVLTGVTYQLFERGAIRFNYPSKSTFPVRGIDVSHHQGVVEWHLVSADGVHFAYLKASEGASFKDERFAFNWAEARQAGIIPGAYHFYSLCKPPLLQAANFLAAAPPSSGDSLPPAVDLEFGGNCGRRPTPEAFRSDLAIFLEMVERAWRRPVLIYVTPEFYPVYVKGHFPSNPLWVRSVFSTPPWAGFGPWDVWQYANRGNVNGITTFVDLNVYRGSQSAFHDVIGHR